MAFTRNLQTASPAGTDQISDGAAAIRALSVDFHERLASAFANVNSDPLTLKNGTVITAMLADGAVTLDKLAAFTVLTIGALTVTTVVGNGAGLTDLNAANLSTGVIPLARIPATITNLTITNLIVGGAITGNITGSAGSAGTATLAITAQNLVRSGNSLSIDQFAFFFMDLPNGSDSMSGVAPLNNNAPLYALVRVAGVSYKILLQTVL